MNPENPPEIDWNSYKSQIANKEVVSQLQTGYSSLKIPYPKDAVTPLIDQQEKDCQVTVQDFCKQSNDKIKEAEALVSSGSIFCIMTELVLIFVSVTAREVQDHDPVWRNDTGGLRSHLP